MDEHSSPGESGRPQNPSQADGGSTSNRERIGPLGWSLELFVEQGLETCRSQIAIKVGEDREGWVKDEWYWIELLKLVRNETHGHSAGATPE
jgi:hypothetical protein